MATPENTIAVRLGVTRAVDVEKAIPALISCRSTCVISVLMSLSMALCNGDCQVQCKIERLGDDSRIGKGIFVKPLQGGHHHQVVIAQKN